MDRRSWKRSEAWSSLGSSTSGPRLRHPRRPGGSSAGRWRAFSSATRSGESRPTSSSRSSAQRPLPLRPEPPRPRWPTSRALPNASASFSANLAAAKRKIARLIGALDDSEDSGSDPFGSLAIQRSVPEGCRAPASRWWRRSHWRPAGRRFVPGSPIKNRDTPFRRAFRLPAWDCWAGATPGRQGRGCENTLDPMPHQALGAGGRSSHGTFRRCATAHPAAVPQDVLAPADKQEGRVNRRRAEV